MIKKGLKYKDKIIFERVLVPKAKRIPKLYEDTEACFMFLDGGSFSIRSSGSILKINENSALLSKCMNYFFEIEDYNTLENEYLQAIGVMLYPSIITEVFDVKLLKGKKKNSFSLKAVNIDPLLQSFKESITYLIDHPELADDEMISIKLREFVHLMMRQEQNDSIVQFFSNLFDPVAYNLEQTIQNNLFSNLSIDELAFLTKMSVSTFKRRFKELYQETPHKYILRKKIERACDLLQNSNLIISEIADECGFDGIATFNRNFKKQNGLSPTDWLLQI